MRNPFNLRPLSIAKLSIADCILCYLPLFMAMADPRSKTKSIRNAIVGFCKTEPPSTCREFNTHTEFEMANTSTLLHWPLFLALSLTRDQIDIWKCKKEKKVNRYIMFNFSPQCTFKCLLKYMFRNTYTGLSKKS